MKLSLLVLAGILLITSVGVNSFNAGERSGYSDGLKDGRVAGIKVTCLTIANFLLVPPEMKESFANDCQRAIK